MNISEIILNIEELDEETVLYAKRIDSRFMPLSEGVVLELTEEERDLRTVDIADKYCRDFEYFLEVFMIKEMVEEMKVSTQYKTPEQIVERVIYYAEFDA